jgi:hypothetical protein
MYNTNISVLFFTTDHHAMKAYWWRYSFTHSLTSALDGGGQLHSPAALLPGKETLVPIGKEAGWAAEPFWKKRKIHSYRRQ